MALTQGSAWLLLGIACLAVPRTWQVRSNRATGWADAVRYRWNYGSTARRVRLRLKLLERNAVLWLSCRERGQAVGLWLLGIFGAGLLAVAMSYGQVGWFIWSSLGKVIVLFLYLRVAAHAPRFFIEARRTGLTELLLVGPLKTTEIISGHWRALLRTLGPPAGFMAAVQVAAVCFSSNVTSRMMLGGRGTGVIPEEVIIAINAGVAAVTVIGNLLALAWFGMWMGVTSKSANLAALKTLLFAQVVPWILFWISFASLTAMLARVLFMQSNSVPPWWVELWPSLPGWWIAALSLIKNVAFVAWSWKRLHSSFRYQAASSWTHPRALTPTPPPAIAPPVIPVAGQERILTYPSAAPSENPEQPTAAGT